MHTELDDSTNDNIFTIFFKSRTTVATFVVSILVSFSFGSTASIIPEILSDRYARISHSYDGPSCWDYHGEGLPKACQQGSDDAQAASAVGGLALNILTILFNSVIGSYSDVHGRKGPILFGIFLSMVAPLVLVLMQIIPTMHPIWYYTSNSAQGIVNYMSIMFAAISDVVPEDRRATCFAIMLAGFYGGFALAPSISLLMSHMSVSILSLVLAVLGFLVAAACFPGTRPAATAESQTEMLVVEGDEENENNNGYSLSTIFLEPFKKLSILNRTTTLRLLTIGSFFSSAVFATDANLVIFYVESHFNVDEADLARMFLAMGIVGVLMQGFLLHPLTICMGEKALLVATFLSGTLHNLLYGLSRTKEGIYVALCLSQFTKLNFALLSSVASKGASELEQGQLQGSLFSINAVSAAIGPVIMQSIYHCTKDTFGPGTMFVFSGFLYFLGTVSIALMPVKCSNTITSDELAEPLIESMSQGCEGGSVASSA